MTLAVDRVRYERTKNLQQLMLIMSGTAWHSLTPGPARSRSAGEGGEPGKHQVFVFDILIP